MKKIIAFIIFFSFASIVSSESLYVTDSFEITLRTGKGIEHKIVGMIPSGEKVEVLESDEKWTKVKRRNGKEGWVLSRFLKSEAPNYVKLESLTGKYEAIVSRNEKNTTELKELRQENINLKNELDSLKKEFSNLSKKHSKLKEESADYLSLKSEFEKNAKALEEKKNKTQELEKKLMERSIKLLVIGAAVMLIGVIVGMSTRKKKRGLYY